MLANKTQSLTLVRWLGVSGVIALLMLGLNSLWYAVLMKGVYTRDTGSWVSVGRDNPSVPIILLSFLVLGSLMTLAYPHVRVWPSRWANGLTLGLFTALVFILPSGLYYFATTNILVLEVLAMDVLWHLIEESTAGLALAALLGARGDTRVNQKGVLSKER